MGEKKKENLSGNGTTLSSNPTICFPQHWVGTILVLGLGWKVFTPWLHVLPLAMIQWKLQDLLFIPGILLPPRARPHACQGHFKSPLQPGNPLAEGLAGMADSADVSVKDWQGQDTHPGSPQTPCAMTANYTLR